MKLSFVLSYPEWKLLHLLFCLFYPSLLESIGIFVGTCMDVGFMPLKSALSVKLKRMGLTSKDLQT